MNKNSLHQQANFYASELPTAEFRLIAIPNAEMKEIQKCSAKDVANLERRHLVSIARYLDHGQTLNLSTLGEGAIEKLKKPRKQDPMDVYRQYFEEFCTYYETAPNGKLLQRKYLPNIALLHETEVLPRFSSLKII